MNNSIRWTGYEFEYREKTSDWFWAVGIIIVSASIILFIYGNTIFGIFLILAGITLLSNAKNEPRLIDYHITDKGIAINGKLYPHLAFNAFYVLDTKYSAPKLLLRTSKIVNPFLIITIETDYVDPKDVRDFLLDYIPEEEMHEPTATKIMDLLGF